MKRMYTGRCYRIYFFLKWPPLWKCLLLILSRWTCEMIPWIWETTHLACQVTLPVWSCDDIYEGYAQHEKLWVTVRPLRDHMLKEKWAHAMSPGSCSRLAALHTVTTDGWHVRFRSDTHGGEWGNIDPEDYQKDVTNTGYDMAERTYCWHDLKLRNP